MGGACSMDGEEEEHMGYRWESQRKEAIMKTEL
jgi:hypothetical protein